jgi:23S rRNA (adenine1618-N6)-methyltransferase
LVYTLLGASAFGWHMTAIDTDPSATAAAQCILSANPALEPLVAIACTPDHGQADDATGSTADDHKHENGCAVVGALPVAMLPPTRAAGSSASLQLPTAIGDARILSSGARCLGPFDFCICNPPFFEHTGQAFQNPDTALGGTTAEMACRGGEAAFVGRLIEESAQFPGLCHWFTAMLGKKATFKALRRRLQGMSRVTAVRTTELSQGRTHRWAVAWSFQVAERLATQPLRAGKRCGGAQGGNASAEWKTGKCKLKRHCGCDQRNGV